MGNQIWAKFVRILKIASIAVYIHHSLEGPKITRTLEKFPSLILSPLRDLTPPSKKYLPR